MNLYLFVQDKADIDNIKYCDKMDEGMAA